MPDIQYLGHSCFRLRGRDGTVLTDPYGRAVGDVGKPTAHIVTVSHHHDDHDNTEAVKPLREQLVVIDGPGEYEVGGILISGVQSYHDKEKGAERGRNTIYVIHLDDVVFCHLGDLGHALSKSQIEEIGVIDVLFVPAGDGETISVAEAVELISEIEPRMVIPMHYAHGQLHPGGEELQSVERFAAAIGLKDWTPEAKLSVSPASLPAEDDQTKVVVMEPVA